MKEIVESLKGKITHSASGWFIERQYRNSASVDGIP